MGRDSRFNSTYVEGRGLGKGWCPVEAGVRYPVQVLVPVTTRDETCREPARTGLNQIASASAGLVRILLTREALQASATRGALVRTRASMPAAYFGDHLV